MTNSNSVVLKQKRLLERREFFLEPNRIRLFIKDLDGETEKYIPYETITPNTRSVTVQDGRVYIAAISFGIFALVGFALYFLGISSLMRWTPVWSVASIIFFGFHFYKRRKYLLLDLTDNTSIFFLANNPSKESLQDFISSLYAMRKKYIREKYFVFNPANDPDKEIARFRFLLEQEIISESEFEEMKKIIIQTAISEFQQTKGFLN
ncbi:MAG: hypothetical protein N2383_05840 [Caldilineales bacterium]|nr:hypothetical protein [Caldilineales bacterium]